MHYYFDEKFPKGVNEWVFRCDKDHTLSQYIFHLFHIYSILLAYTMRLQQQVTVIRNILMSLVLTVSLTVMVANINP